MSTRLLQYRSKLTIATFNVRGLTAKTSEKLWKEISTDSYHIDICVIQETKISNHVNEVLPNRYQLITYPQANGHQRGIGFLTSPRMRPFLSKYYALTDRVAAADFHLPCGRNRKDTNRIRIITAYGPTLKTSTENPQLKEEFYDAITSLWHEAANGRSLCFIAGDFNSKVGLQSWTVLEECMGRYGKGSRNENGQTLVDWAIQEGAFQCNTAFQHSCRHRTTWRGWIKAAQGETKQPVCNQ